MIPNIGNSEIDAVAAVWFARYPLRSLQCWHRSEPARRHRLRRASGSSSRLADGFDIAVTANNREIPAWGTGRGLLVFAGGVVDHGNG